MRIAIVGAGVGGLSLARALNRLGVQNITVFDRRLSPLPRTDRGLGLWDDSQSCLRALDVPIDTIGYSIPPAAYRNKRGTWLSRCSQTPENLSRVRSVSQNDLLGKLSDGIEPSIVFGRELEGVARTARGSLEMRFKKTKLIFL